MSDTVALNQGLPTHVGPGLIIASKYRLEEEIGRGSMGTVFRAVHVTLGQRVAIKLISSEYSQSAEARKRFSVEAKAAAKLRSRHVVQVYDDGETPEGNPYIVLEYLDGETLEQRLEREHDVPLTDAVRIVGHVARALARAHAEGIVHRDLKPANIFLVRTEEEDAGWLAKVLDFGIAKLEDVHGEKGTTQAGTVLGTPLFMSPEQVRGASSVDHRADLYSLGMCLFHMLTGEFAYYSPNYSDILVGICTLPLPRLREKAPWVPETVEQWFQRACAKEPLERFQSADEMSEALQAAAGGLTPPSKHKSVPEGRIAPETLVGYAAPALVTVQLEQPPLSLARTQPVAMPLPGAATTPGLAPTPPIPIAVSAGTGESIVTGDWVPPRRNLRPLLLGAGIGLVAVVALLLVSKLFGTAEPASAVTGASAAATGPAAPSPATAPSAVPLVEPSPKAPASPGSSVAAESAPSEPTAPPISPKKAAPSPASAPKKSPSGAAGPRPGPGPATKTSGSDLGF
ncbi:MAG TPA: protein kinase [Polyangiaceae bacterium]|nr:protein kinase [Polyangiaceae bacterium]